MEVAAQPSAPVNTGLMLPPPSQPGRGPSVTVLDEDEWTERIGGIIRRDFFPDLPKLENKLEWLQAVRTGDPENMRQAQMNIAQRRAGMKTPLGATPAHLATPGASMLWAPIRQGTPAMTPGAATPGQTPSAYQTASQPAGSSDAAAQGIPSMSLDRFFKHHNSEDNASFSVIREGEAKRRRAQKPWLFTDKNQKQLEAPSQDVSNLHMLPAPHDDRPNLLISWPHTNKNALYYDSSQQAPLALTKEELAEQVQGPPRQISHSNTRMKASDAEEHPVAQSPAEPGASSHVSGLPGNRGYVATPSFTPGAGGESPLMTWGDIDGTPLRLDADDDIHVEPVTAGPQFKVPEPAKRDELGRDMAQRARHSLQRKIQARMRTPLQSPMGTPGAFGRRGGQTPMSPAARRLASNLHGRPQKPDSQLRASYRTPSRMQPPSTPLAPHGWDSAMPSPAPAASLPDHCLQPSKPTAGKAPVVKQPDADSRHLTDGLLQL
ncbi:hypothetical protein WJX84_012037 [Apatococcus fuscideae]|uniref:Uncharacterized protein n=1 Tax=Apatococcus fuscideae TaxID=2026836 RepID=A0AAW1S022_9CHLO